MCLISYSGNYTVITDCNAVFLSGIAAAERSFFSAIKSDYMYVVVMLIQRNVLFYMYLN